MTTRQFIWLTALFLTAVFLFALSPVDPHQAHIDIIQIQDSINPGVEDFMKYAIKRSADDKAECLIILLDTPGGLMTSMRGISQAILNSQVPIVVYVSPSGAQAASAGVFITVAADIAAMAPGTNIGAAHPVTGGGGEMPSSMSEKVLNDTLAFARSIAAQRGRNAEWMEDSVRKSVSATAEEAFKLNVIDLVADNLPALIKRLDNWHLQRGGTTVVLKTNGVELRTISPSLQHDILRIISNPNLAYILLMIGLAGIYFELSSPGAVVPGVIGGISLILALYALQALPVNYAGFLIILLAVLFFILEIKIASHGLLSLAGVLCMVMGSVMLFRNPEEPRQIALSVFLPTTVAVSIFFAAVARLAFNAQRTKPQTGQDALLGMIGEVQRAIDPEGKVFVNGELWNAQADQRIEVGDKVEVLEVHNLKLKVKRIGDR
ncbi:MAG TPA: nodulation protein NfeD [Deltaproteobacteria bacterium]|jgi:membrane-bound serine protease (ClpP class)|nr:nodulation protein NfeD [Deltaproteobacteria bacterium]HIJ76761.1 nodulation protein NfeD [Deltaproteobacteria bacterium]